MDISSSPRYVDSNVEAAGSSSGSTSDPSPHQRSIHSDEEIMLASSYPKKRAGRTKFKETRHPVYRGVRRRNNNKWVCELREPNKKSRIWLGTYSNPEMAARAHDVAALALRGNMACLNFADSAWRLPRPASNNTSDIQKAAAAAAEKFGSLPVSSPRPAVYSQQPAASSSSSSPVAPASDIFGGCFDKHVISDEFTIKENGGFYVDEEEMFDMPGLLVSMAEGMLLSPPSADQCVAAANDQGGCGWGNGDMSLWSYSF